MTIKEFNEKYELDNPEAYQVYVQAKRLMEDEKTKRELVIMIMDYDSLNLDNDMKNYEHRELLEVVRGYVLG